MQDGREEPRHSMGCYHGFSSPSWAHTHARPPAGTKGPEASARTPVPVFSERTVPKVRDQNWWEMGLGRRCHLLTFQPRSLARFSASPRPDAENVPWSCGFLRLSTAPSVSSSLSLHITPSLSFSVTSSYVFLFRKEDKALRRAPSTQEALR